MSTMTWRDLTETEKQALNDEIRELAWAWTRRLAGLGPNDTPFSLFETKATPAEETSRHLAMVKTLERIAYFVQRQIEDNTTWSRQPDPQEKP